MTASRGSGVCAAMRARSSVAVIAAVRAFCARSRISRSSAWSMPAVSRACGVVRSPRIRWAAPRARRAAQASWGAGRAADGVTTIRSGATGWKRWPRQAEVRANARACPAAQAQPGAWPGGGGGLVASSWKDGTWSA
ncbi:hypothetical protein D5H75_31440 [Bailinhaonella thermotolerans]|uniref:Uncharacterized protein n=1 Tax=Bailinhaonella thermotolerans TaxID=1070861 RepID=A0A3A4AWZ6_9ACTN|nr:hypothetical protein D5H75_31440 [Bailinhaonella thermotolerans]